MFQKIINIFGLIFNLLILSVISFALLLSLIVSYYGKNLPSAVEIENYKPDTLSRIYDDEGNVLGIFGEKKRIYTPIEDIPILVQNAFISAEDKNFYFHAGYDPLSLLKAITDAMRGKKLRGASTITQQVMKNFLLSGKRTAKRKIKEIILAARIERVLTKKEILNVYLNEIYLGQGAYGVTAASLTYFDKKLVELNVAEAAYLAALPKAPSFYHPIREKRLSVDRRNFVIKEMKENGYISSSMAEKFRSVDLVTTLNSKKNKKDFTLSKKNSYFNDAVRRQLIEKYPSNLLKTDGLTVMATLNPRLQEIARHALQKQLITFDQSNGLYRGPSYNIDISSLKQNYKSEVNFLDSRFKEILFNKPLEEWSVGVVKSVQKKTVNVFVYRADGSITEEKLLEESVSWVQKRKTIENKHIIVSSLPDIFTIGDVIYLQKKSTENGLKSNWVLRQVPEVEGALLAMDPNSGKILAMQGGFSYVTSKFNRALLAKRQPGSAFKPFVYLTALENGFFPNSVLVDAPVTIGQVEGVWRPKNASSDWFGVAPLRKGLEHSKNLMTVRLAKEIGMREVAKYAKILGIYEHVPEYLSYSLGAGETTLIKLVSAYAVLANGGLEIEPTFFETIQNRYGLTIYKHGSLKCLGCSVTDLDVANKPVFLNLGTRLINPISTYQINSILQGVVERGTASKTVGKLGIKIAGKTGTTNDSKDLWFIGYTPEIVIGCYIGYDKPKSLGQTATGGKFCGDAFSNFYKEAFGDKPFKWETPTGTKFIEVDYDTGKQVKSHQKSDQTVIYELYREDENLENVFSRVIHDGGFAIGQDLLLLNSTGENVNNEDLNRAIGSIMSGGQY